MRIRLETSRLTASSLAVVILTILACSPGDQDTAQVDTMQDSVAAAAREPAAPQSLYDRLGGKSAIASVVDSFVARVAADTRINKKFARSNIPRVKAMLVDQICNQTGGPCTYTGRSMKEAHRDMKVTEGEFNALVEDLVATLNQFNVPKAEQDELLTALGSMKADIVEVQSAETGTTLPASFKPAPASDTSRARP
ncbi:MAG: group 1 truncated hemoglobin [Gemmatimonadota bacterium]|nr:group 1 truncated hemoglobin [Gemmatimonadota bacterium]